LAIFTPEDRQVVGRFVRLTRSRRTTHLVLVIVNSYLHEQTDDLKGGGLALTGLVTLLLEKMAFAAVFPPAM